ncbi:MAG: hypothetical protein R2701_03910 [Acidimicrobiales bacterium]
MPRLVGRVLHLSSPYQFLIVQWLLAIVMLAVIARLLDEALDDRRAAVVGTFGAVGLWAVASADRSAATSMPRPCCSCWWRCWCGSLR